MALQLPWCGRRRMQAYNKPGRKAGGTIFRFKITMNFWMWFSSTLRRIVVPRYPSSILSVHMSSRDCVRNSGNLNILISSNMCAYKVGIAAAVSRDVHWVVSTHRAGWYLRWKAIGGPEVQQVETIELKNEQLWETKASVFQPYARCRVTLWVVFSIDNHNWT